MKTSREAKMKFPYEFLAAMRKLISGHIRIVAQIGNISVAVLLLGCAAPSRIEPYPADWPALKIDHCSEVFGDYSVSGFFSPLAAKTFQRQPYLDVWLFKMEHNNLATRIRITYDTTSENLRAVFYSSRGTKIAEHFEKMYCEGGALIKIRRDIFHADFISGDAMLTTKIFQAVDGSLILYNQTQVSETDFLIFPGSRTEESWVKFPYMR